MQSGGSRARDRAGGRVDNWIELGSAGPGGHCGGTGNGPATGGVAGGVAADGRATDGPPARGSAASVRYVLSGQLDLMVGGTGPSLPGQSVELLVGHQPAGVFR